MGVAGGDPLSAAVAVARAHGLRVGEPVVLRDRLNLLVHLEPAPVVARVPRTIARIRPGDEWTRRELGVAGHLAAAGAPVVAPSRELPPGPHVHGEHVVSFWTHVPPADADPRAAAAGLRECHDALRGYDGPLPVLGALTEAEALLARLPGEGAIAPGPAARLQDRFDALRGALRELGPPLQPLHGDAHLGNVLGGRLWNDFEDMFLGPAGWDVACLLLHARARGDEARARAALNAAGLAVDAAELAPAIEARTLQVLVWVAFVVREHPERRAALEPWLRAAGLDPG